MHGPDRSDKGSGVKIVTWNVNSVKVRKERLLAFLERERPDVLCLQELKCVDEAFPREPVEALGYHCTLFGQKTYNGVAILSLSEPTDIHRGLEDDVDDPQSRLVSACVDGVHVLSAYFPNGGNLSSEKYPYKLAWMKRLRDYLDRRFAPTDAVALCGDYNVAPFDDDISDHSEFANTVLTTPEVRGALSHIQDFGFEDAFRPFHPEGGIFSWWDYRARGFERDNGLRIDHVYLTAPLACRVIGAQVDRGERQGDSPSDHAPVMVEIAKAC